MGTAKSEAVPPLTCDAWPYNQWPSQMLLGGIGETAKAEQVRLAGQGRIVPLIEIQDTVMRNWLDAMAVAGNA